MDKALTNKKKKISTWIYLSISVLINAFIITQACLPGDVSSQFSNFFYNMVRGITNGSTDVAPTWQYDPDTPPVNPPADSFNFEFIEVNSGNDIKDKVYKAEVDETIDIWVKQINTPEGGVTFTTASTDESVANANWEYNHIKITCYKEGNTRISLTALEITHYLDLTVVVGGVINHTNEQSVKLGIRKSIGHFLLFFVNGIFTFLFLYNLLKDNKKYKNIHILLIVLSIGLFIAILSECIQFAIPKRSPQGWDILIDFTGYAIASILLSIIKQINLKNNN